MPQPQKGPRSGLGGSLAAGGAVLLAVACCALGPVLIAGGALGIAGGILRNPAVLTLAALVLIGAVLYALHRRSQSRRAAGAHPPLPQDATGDGVDCGGPGGPRAGHGGSDRSGG